MPRGPFKIDIPEIRRQEATLECLKLIKKTETIKLNQFNKAQ